MANKSNAAPEEADFPVVCENCLGPDPYVRMIKIPFGHECHVCQKPCIAFRFKPGGAGTRYKMTVICQNCAKTKNMCQVCMFDLTYGLPVQIADNPNLTEHDLRHLARTTPYYKRNKARICSFWVKGECKRGATCPYRHELPTEDTIENNSKAAYKMRFHGVNDPIANKLLARLQEEKNATLQKDDDEA